MDEMWPDDDYSTTSASLPSLDAAVPRRGGLLRLFSSRVSVRSGADVSEPRSHRRASDTSLCRGSPPSSATDSTEGRSYVGVLRRISSILGAGGQGGPGDSELKQHWLPDAVSRECYDCGDKFTTFRRRHHCRICGQIFCSRCCNQVIPGKVLGYSGDLRVCTYCSKVVMTYVQTITSGADADEHVDQNAVLEKVHAHLEAANQLSSDRSSSLPRLSKMHRKKYSLGMTDASLRDQVDPHESVSDPLEQEQDLTYLTTLLHMITNPIHGVGLGNHRHRLKNYGACLVGSEVVDWMISQRKVTRRAQSVAIGQRLVDMKLLECVSHNTTAFRDDYCLYRPSPVAMRRPALSEPEEPDLEEPHWLSQIELKESHGGGAATDEPAGAPLAHSGSMYDIELDVSGSVASISRAQLLRQMTPPEPAAAAQGLHEAATEYLDSAATEADPRRQQADKRLSAAFEALESSLLSQLLDSAGLPAKWYEPILDLSRQLSRLVKPDVRHECDDLDVRQFVKIKRIPGGKPAESQIVQGVVCRKNIVHNDMPSQLTNPQILLISCPVSYQRYQDRAVSLEPMMMQEREVLRNITAQLLSLAPDLIVVEKHVDSMARDMLREAGVTLVTNMKRQVLARIARCTQADVMDHVDARLAAPVLGICHSFYTKQFTMEGGSKKTFMFFDGCASHLGCTVLVRGGHMNQLRRVKHVLRFMVSVQYNWLLQKSYLRDLVSVPPPFGNQVLLAQDEAPEDSRDKTRAGSVSKTNGASSRPRASTAPPDVATVAPATGDERLRSPRRPGEMVTDCSDPLQRPAPAPVPDTSTPGLKVEILPDRNKFRKLLGDTIVCCTPYARVAMPYLETEEGKRSSLRRFFTANLYWSVEFDKAEKARRAHIRKAPIETRPGPTLLPEHEFVTRCFTRTVDDDQMQALLADFRARGGRCPRVEPVEPNQVEPVQDRLEDWVVPCDALNPINHQKIAVQTYTYSKLPSGVSVGCCDPHVMMVMFNGDSDTTLGTFLEAECFTPAFKCLKKDCVVPQEGHVHRFLHDNSCVSLLVWTLLEPCPDKRIWMWTWCRQCERGSAARPMTEDTWTLSFGKFLETFFLCEQYSSLDGCSHSLFRDRAHYFALQDRVAVFSHSQIQLNDIVLPQLDITVELGPRTQLRLTEDLHALSEGVQLFSSIVERLLSLRAAAASDAKVTEALRTAQEEVDDEKRAFRTLLTDIETMVAPLVGEATDGACRLDEDRVFAASDRAVQAKRMMADTAHKWNTRLQELAKAVKAIPRPKAEEVTAEAEKPPKKHSNDGKVLETSTSSRKSSNDQKSSYDSKQKEGADPEPATEDAADLSSVSKVKSITVGGIKALKSLAWSSGELGERLTSSLPVNEHHRLPPTVPPSFICGEDLGSIIAYCMLTQEYSRRLAEIRQQLERPADSAEEPGPERSGRISESSTANSDGTGGAAERGERGEKYLAQYHIDINMSEDNANFYCQVLLAEHFRRLRQAVFSAGEERFVRCLMHCQPWNAKGGKSGSTFHKSCDDRFVIKTISKVEKDHFVRFGIRYVEYILDSLTTGRPSVLAKILGVFLVGYKNNVTGQAKKCYMVVMENLLYGRQISQKFDLKGSMRNRLADTKDKSEVVLLDQNMVTLLSENPLYVRPHAKRVLMEAISRDTSFLQTCQVMDYSLLVGMDETQRCLVVGIIDYLRSYTYDKAVETYIKSYNILLGDGNNRPTVLDPVRYKTRFAVMMNKYFTDVPDRWLGFAQGLGFL
ncbi:putative 1-phosphatidylinositol 3-phosphate 5-kinase [Amphibalanus amphitrite]|uniref:1-phosphatidylinositol-3-phosphate 5-kinase n=2 Tax=Amphibalanus amphitrite TaxID=1232801 RepID=A0A6A4WLT8_AMPAM|nr:1-phosphatidylinositol 3-phosphate 5-kinase-like isoform X1 [Amphibalanus amphitrite]KAF0306219.1 putative 1-phosphatidylinositol 3-phosphate 5-kinase [Amphibalanus amphitrite]